jgi:hypothetical protein
MQEMFFYEHHRERNRPKSTFYWMVNLDSALFISYTSILIYQCRNDDCTYFEGFVSDHISILQDQSRLYHYLSSFETDMKRRLAMDARRVDMLQPLLSSLSKVAYDVQVNIHYIAEESFLSLDLLS